MRSFKSSEHINEKGDGPYHGFGYLNLFMKHVIKVVPPPADIAELFYLKLQG